MPLYSTHMHLARAPPRAALTDVAQLRQLGARRLGTLAELLRGREAARSGAGVQPGRREHAQRHACEAITGLGYGIT